jgi:hypothetical protein
MHVSPNSQILGHLRLGATHPEIKEGTRSEQAVMVLTSIIDEIHHFFPSDLIVLTG